jgi:hypothetical protein
MYTMFQKQQDTTQFVKHFVSNTRLVVWIKKTVDKLSYITLVDDTQNVLIPKDLVVFGSINNPSDSRLKDNVIAIDDCQRINELIPCKYTFIGDATRRTHYGIMAQDLEKVYPSLVNDTVLDGIKTVNYLELVPILVCKVNAMQTEIDELRNIIFRHVNEGCKNHS